MYRGFVFAAMIAAGSVPGAVHQSPVAQDDSALRETRVENFSGDAMNMQIAKIAGRAAFQPPVQAPLTRQEAFTILLLMSEQVQRTRVRS